MEATCSICGNKSSYDKESLAGSKVTINGTRLILCCPCEDELLVKLAKRRTIGIVLGDGGEIAELDVAAYCDTHPKYNVLKLADGYELTDTIG